MNRRSIMKTLVGIFGSQADAAAAYRDLRSLNLRGENLIVLTPEASLQQLEGVPTEEGEQPGMGKSDRWGDRRRRRVGRRRSGGYFAATRCWSCNRDRPRSGVIGNWRCRSWSCRWWSSRRLAHARLAKG